MVIFNGGNKPFTPEEIPTIIEVPPENSQIKEIKLTVPTKGEHWCWLCKSHGPEKSNIGECFERLIITNLTNDLIDIYPYDEFDNDYEFEFWIILHEEEGKGGEYSKYNGEPYLFDPPRKDVFEGSGVLSFLSTPKRWTKMIMSVKHIDDYKKIINYLVLETHRYPGTDHTSPLQEDPEADTFIIQKFNRDLVYYNNMQKLIKK